MLGTSWANLTIHREGTWISGPFLGIKYSIDSNPERPWVGYGDYSRGKWDLSAEYRNTDEFVDILFVGVGMPVMHYNQSTESWFASAAYRVNSKLQVGVYHSNLRVDNPANPAKTASNHIYDEVGTARYDFNRFWDVKVEGHFMDGYGDIYSAQGFYSQWNAAGLKPRTDMLVLRTSVNF